MPPGHNSMPQHGKPEGAIFKSPTEKGSGANVTKPSNPNAASGSTRPGAPENRNMTAIEPRFQKLLAGMVTNEQMHRIQHALAPLTYAVPNQPEVPLPMAA